MDEGPWAAYARLQTILDRTTDAHRAAGIESAMADLLDKIERREPCTARQVNNLVVNRISKERRRRAIAYKSRNELVAEQALDGPAESRLMLIKCLEICGSREFDLLLSHAEGHTFGELAVAGKLNRNTLKIRAHRARQLIVALAA